MQQWEKQLSCASSCQLCGAALGAKSERILSVFSHETICMDCKRTEEKRPDYPDQSKQIIADCIATTLNGYYSRTGKRVSFNSHPLSWEVQVK